MLTGRCAVTGQLWQMDKFQWLNEEYSSPRRETGEAQWKGEMGRGDWQALSKAQEELWMTREGF